MLMDNGPRSEILCGLWQLGRLSQGAYATFVNGTDWNTDHYGPVLQAKIMNKQHGHYKIKVMRLIPIMPKS